MILFRLSLGNLFVFRFWPSSPLEWLNSHFIMYLLFSSDILIILWTDLQQYNANWLPNDERLSKTWLSKSQLSSGISIVMTFVVCCLRAQLAAAAHHKSWASTANYTLLVFFVFLSGEFFFLFRLLSEYQTNIYWYWTFRGPLFLGRALFLYTR